MIPTSFSTMTMAGKIAALDVCVSEYHRPRNDKSGIGSDSDYCNTCESDGFVP